MLNVYGLSDVMACFRGLGSPLNWLAWLLWGVSRGGLLRLFGVSKTMTCFLVMGLSASGLASRLGASQVLACFLHLRSSILGLAEGFREFLQFGLLALSGSLGFLAC